METSSQTNKNNPLTNKNRKQKYATYAKRGRNCVFKWSGDYKRACNVDGFPLICLSTPHVYIACRKCETKWAKQHFSFTCQVSSTQRRRNLKTKFLFLRLDVPSTLICHKNGTFQKRPSKPRNLKTKFYCCG